MADGEQKSSKIPRKTPKEQIEKFLTTTVQARELSQKCREYYDGNQWTEQQIEKLLKRRQAPIVVNRIQPKIDGMLGLLEVRKTDPKAVPRTMREEEFAQVVTDGLRYVNDNTNLDDTYFEVAENAWIEGYGGAIVDIKRGRGGDIEIKIDHIPWDRIYYDPHSRRRDFKDARYMGILMWVDIDDVKSMFPGRKISIKKLLEQRTDPETDGSEDDRPRWYQKDGEDHRVRLAMHFSMVGGVWKFCVFCGDYYIIPERDSPYLDEDEIPTNPIELISCRVDQDNNRYGEVKGMLDGQDEVNHRRSKFLHQNNTRQTYGNERSFSDVGQAKLEFGKPDGHIETMGDAKFGEDWGVINTNDMSAAQFSLYQDAKGEMDRNGFSAPLAGNAIGGVSSGKELQLQQSGAALELSRQYAALAQWKSRVYTQIWWRIKQFWKEEKWIRITDDHDALRWTGFNAKITASKMLQEAANDKRLPPDQRQKNQQILEFLVKTKNPKLNEVVEIKNEVGKLNVDITIEQSYDVANVQREQLDMIIKYAGQFDKRGEIELADIIELSEIRGKDELIRKINQRKQQNMAMQQQTMQKNQQRADAVTQSEIGLNNSEAQENMISSVKKQQEAIGEQIENALLIRNPDRTPQVHT